MTATTKWIEDAIAGGYKDEKTTQVSEEGIWYGMHVHDLPDGETTLCEPYCCGTLLYIEKILLDPLAWQAVGRTRGWEPYSPYDLTAGEQEYLGEWVQIWHDFISHLADGLSIEDALKAIE